MDIFWRNFEKTGNLEDYIRYANKKKLENRKNITEVQQGGLTPEQ